MFGLFFNTIKKIFKFVLLAVVFISWCIFNLILTLFKIVKLGLYFYFFWLMFVFKESALLKVIYHNFFVYFLYTTFLKTHNKFLRTYKIYYEFLVVAHIKWPLIKPLLVELIDFVFMKIKGHYWFSSLMGKGRLILIWDSAYYSTFILYLYVFLFYFSLFVITAFLFCGLYINVLFFVFLIFFLYYIIYFIYFFFTHIFKHLLLFLMSFWILDFIYLLNFFTGYLNFVWMASFKADLQRNDKGELKPDVKSLYKLRLTKGNRFKKALKKKGILGALTSYVGLFLMLVNINNAKLVTFFKKDGLFNMEPHNLAHLPGHEELFFQNLQYNVYQLKEYHAAQDKFLGMPIKQASRGFPLFRKLMVQGLLENFLRPDQFDLFIRARNLTSKTKYPGSLPEFGYFWNLYKSTGMTSRAFDLIASTTWAEKVEDDLLRSRFYVEARYAYLNRHKRTPLLVYNFFRHGVLPVHFWSAFYSQMKRTRSLGRKVDRAVEIAGGFPEIGDQLDYIYYPSRVRRDEIPITISATLEKQQLFLNKRGIYADIGNYNDKNHQVNKNIVKKRNSKFSDIFRTISVDAPIIFSFLANLNYLVLLLFGELFGDFFQKQIHYASNLYNIRLQIEQSVLFDFKIKWFSKIFSFVFFDVWLLFWHYALVFLFFLKFRVFKSDLLWFLLSYSFQILAFFLQALKINDRSTLSFFYVYFYKDFFKFKLKGKRPHRLFKNWGYLSSVIEVPIFFFSFIFIFIFDVLYLLSKALLKKDFFVYLWFFFLFFSSSFIKFFLVYVFNPLYNIILYCEDFDLDTRRFQKQEGLNIYGKGPQVFESSEIFFIGFLFWKNLVKKYWWDLEVEHEKGIKRWPFFYKFSKKFFWFDKCIILLRDAKTLLVYLFKHKFITCCKNISIKSKGWFQVFLYATPFLLLYICYVILTIPLSIFLFCYKFFSSMSNKFQKKFKVKPVDVEHAKGLTFSNTYENLLKDKIFSLKSNKKDFQWTTKSSPVLSETDVSFLSKIKDFYIENENRRIKFFEKAWNKNKNAFKTDDKPELQTAVNSLYSLYGYNNLKEFGADVDVYENIEKETQTDVFKLKKILWSNGIYKTSNYISTNIDINMDFKKVDKGKQVLYAKHKTFFLNSSTQDSHKLMTGIRHENLKHTSETLNNLKTRSHFPSLDKYFFTFFCRFWEKNLKLLYWKDNLRLNLSKEAYSKVFFKDAHKDAFSDLSYILMKSNQTRLDNLKDLFDKKSTLINVNSFLRFFKTKFSKQQLSGSKAYDNASHYDFVTFFHRFNKTLQNGSNPLVLDFKTKMGLNLMSNGQNRDSNLNNRNHFIENKYIKNDGILNPLLNAFKKVWLYERSLVVYLYELARNKWYKSEFTLEPKISTTKSELDFCLESEFDDLNIFIENNSSIPENDKLVIKLASYLFKFKPEMKFFTSAVIHKMFDRVFKKIVLYHSKFLVYFLNFLTRSPAKLMMAFSHIFFFIWQITVLKTMWIKCLFYFWNFLSKEIFIFYTRFIYADLFQTHPYIHNGWFEFSAQVFSMTLFRYYEESFKEGSFFRGIPAEEYKWRGDVAQSFEFNRWMVDKFFDLTLRERVSVIKLKKKGELISDHELFWRNFLKQEKGLLSPTERPDSIIPFVFQVGGNIIIRSRAYAIYRFLLMAANVRFYYHRVVLGYDKEKRVTVFLEEHPEFKDLFGDQKDPHYWKRSFKSKQEEKSAKKKRNFYIDKVFLHLLPDLWFFGRRFLQIKLWREHFFFKFWLWMSTTSNFKTHLYFFFFIIIILGVGFFNILSLSNCLALLSVFYSYFVFLYDTLIWLIEWVLFYVLGFSWTILREFAELFFYNFILHKDLQSILLSLNLYDVFLFLMHNFVLYEANIFVKERVILIFITTFWVLIHTIVFDMITLPLLLTNFVLHSLYIIDLLHFVNQYPELVNFVYIFKQLIIWILNFYLNIFYKIVFKIIPTISWQLLFFFEYGYDYFWVCFLAIMPTGESVLGYFGLFCLKIFVKTSPGDFAPNIMLLYEDLYLYWFVIFWDAVLIAGQPLHILDLSMELWEFVDAVYCVFVFEPIMLWMYKPNDLGYEWLLSLKASTPAFKLFNIIYVVIGSSVTIIVNSILLVFVEILIRILDVFIFINFCINFIFHFFFEDIIFSELVIFVLHVFVWLYLNLIYYVILVPFMYLIFGSFFLIKFVLFLPVNLWALVKSVFAIVLFAWKYFFAIFSGFIDFFFLIEDVLRKVFSNAFFVWVFESFVQIITYFGVFVFIPFKLIFSAFTTFYGFISPFFVVNSFIILLWDIINEFWYSFYILFRETFFVFLVIIKLIFKFFINVFSGIAMFFWFFVEVLDALFPSLKHIFNPIGGVSIFFATFYYYLFVFVCYVWSLSFRAFNDTTREPPLPSEVWPEVVDDFEDHPVIQHLPFDVYQLLYSEKLATREGLPPKLDQSLRSWIPSKHQPNLARLTQVKTTPLNVQGYYYKFLNDLARKAVKKYYKTRWWFFFGTMEKLYRSLGVKEFLHFLRELPLDILDATAEFLRFEWKADKPIFERDAKKTLGERLNLPIIMQSFELIFPKDVQHRRRRDAQIFEQYLVERFGSGQADEVIWSFPVLGKIFNIRSPQDQQEYFKLEVMKAGWKHGFDANLTPAQREIKKKLVLHWILRSRDHGLRIHSFQTEKWKNGQAMVRYVVPAGDEERLNMFDFEHEMGGSIRRGYSEKFKQSEAIRRLEKVIERDLDRFHLKRYEKIAVVTDIDGESLADPLFLTVRALDLFLYPVLVFATVNTGWWYSSNGIVDAVMRYVELEEYAGEMADVFEKDMHLDAVFSNKDKLLRKIGSEAVSNMVLFDSKEAVDLFFPTQRTVDWFWEKFAKEHPELKSNFSLFMEQDPYYFLEAASSYMMDNLDTTSFGKDSWADHVYGFWKYKKRNMHQTIEEPVSEKISMDLEYILDSFDHVKSENIYNNKAFNQISKDFKLTSEDKQYNFKEKWKEFLSGSEENEIDSYEKSKLEFLAKIYNEDFLGYALYVASDFDLKRYKSSGAYFYPDWHDKEEIIEHKTVIEDDITKLKKLYDKVTADEAKRQLERNVIALKKLVEEESFDTETEESRRALLQYALDNNIVHFDFEDEEQEKFAKVLEEGGGDQYTDEELEEMHKKAKERFHSIFIQIFTAFDGPQKEPDPILQQQREEKQNWFYRQLQRFKPVQHPLREKEAIDDLMLVYHNFQKDPGFWFWSNPVLYKGLLSFYKDSFDNLDRRGLYLNEYNKDPMTLLMKPTKDMIDYYFLEEYINPKTEYYPRLLQYVDQTPIPIARGNPYPFGHELLEKIEHRYNVRKPYSYIQEWIDMFKEYEISVYEEKGRDPRFTAIFQVDVDLFREEVLFGHVFYKFYTSGFLSLFEDDTLKWLLWGFYKIYEGSIFGDLLHKVFTSLFANSLIFGPSMLPMMIRELDPYTRMAFLDRFAHGDLAPFRRDFYNPYTGFTFYHHNKEVYMKRAALLYFSNPEYFSDSWFLAHMQANPFIAVNTLTEHMKHASYEKSSIFHSSEMNIQLTSFLKRYMSEEIKMLIRFGLYVWMYTSQFADILSDYFSTYALLRTLYEMVITPIVLFYNVTKSLYFVLNAIGRKVYQLYIYLTINLRILETITNLLDVFVYKPTKELLYAFLYSFEWGFGRIWGWYNTEFLVDMGFDAWWKRTLIRSVFLAIGPAFEFIHFSYFLKPTRLWLLLKKRFFEYTELFWNLDRTHYLLTHPFFGFKYADMQLPWIRGIGWVGVGIKHYSRFRRKILEYTFLWFVMDNWLKFNITPIVFGFYNISDWNYSSWQLLWQMTSPHWFFTKLHVYMPWVLSDFIIMLCEKLNLYIPLYENLEEFILQWTSNAYNVGVDMRALGEWKPYSLDDSHSQWAFVLSLADLKGLDKAYKDYFGFFSYAVYEATETNKSFVKLRSLTDKPFILREAIQAPYSIAISDGLIVLSKSEQNFLSRRAINKVFSKDLFFAFDFLTAYNENSMKSDTGFKMVMRQGFSDMRFWNAYGVLETASNISLRPVFTHEVSSNFYSNMRKYEEELGMRKLRYFFNRYQWLIQDVFPYKTDITQLSDLFVEMAFKRGILDVMHMRFSNTKQIPELTIDPREETPILRISLDVYGNFIYSLEGPEWFVNPERGEMEILVNDLLDPMLDDFVGFMINKVYPTTKRSIRFAVNKISEWDKKLLGGRGDGPSKEWIKLAVSFEEKRGIRNPQYVWSLGGHHRYRVKDYLGEDYKSPSRLAEEQEEAELQKEQQAEMEELKAQIRKEWGESSLDKDNEVGGLGGWNPTAEFTGVDFNYSDDGLYDNQNVQQSVGIITNDELKGVVNDLDVDVDLFVNTQYQGSLKFQPISMKDSNKSFDSSVIDGEDEENEDDEENEEDEEDEENEENEEDEENEENEENDV